MTSKFLLPLAAVALLTLAGCSNPETPAEPAATTETAPAVTAPEATAPAVTETAPAVEVAPVAPAAEPAVVPAEPAMAPAADATTITPEQAMQAVQEQVSGMTDAQKTETIAAARKAAEDAATAQGLSAEQVKQAGDMAEQAAKQALGVQ